MTVVSSLVIEMAANVARLKTDMDQARKVVDDSMGRITNAVEGAQRAFGLLAAAAGGATFGVAIKNAINLADQMDDLAEKTGITAKALSSLRFAGEATGTPMDALSTGLRKLSQNMASASSGSKEQAEMFARLGVSVNNASGSLRGSDAVLRDLADRFSAMQDGPGKAALAMELFGKSGVDMVPLLNQGADGIEALHDEAVKLGAVIGNDFAKQAADFNDNLTKMTAAGQGFFMVIAEQVLPILNRMASAFLDAQSGGSTFATLIGKTLKVALETVLVLGANVVFVFQGIWRELRAVYEQAAALLTLDFDRLKNVKIKLDLDNTKALQDLKNFETAVMGAGGRGAGYSDPRLEAARAQLKEAGLIEEANATRQFEAQKRLAELREKAAKDQARQAAEAAKALEKLIADGVKLSESLTAIDSGLSPDFAAKWDSLQAAFKAGALSTEQVLAAQKALLAQQPAMKKAEEERLKRIQAQADADQKAVDAMHKDLEALRNANKALELHNEEIGLTTEQLNALRIARLDEEIAIQQTIVAEYEEIKARGGVTEQLQEQINKLEELKKKRELTLGGQSAQVAVDAAKKARDEWQRTAEKIESSLTDALMRGFESGKGFFRNLRDTVVNMFKTLVLRPQVQAIVTGGMSALGLGAPGQASAGGIGDMASMGMNALGLGGAGAMFSSGVMSGLSAWGAGGSVTGLLGSGSALFSGGLMNGLGTIAGALGPIALGLGALYALSKKLDTSGTIHTGGSASYSASSGLQTNISQSRTGFAYIDRRAETETFAGGIAQSIVGLLDSTATAFGKQAGYSAATAFADDSSKDGAWGSLVLSKGGKDLLNWADTRQSKWAPKTFADGEEGIKQYMAAVGKDVRDMLMQETPEWADAMLRALGDAPTIEQLGGVVQQITAIQNIFTQFGEAMPQLKGITDEAVGSLMQLAGGVGNLQQGLSNYVNLFYSDAEKQALATKSLSDSMAALGLSLPATNAEFRKLVEAQDLNTEAGRRQYAALIALAPAFDQVSKAAEAANKRIMDERIQLENQLLELQGNTVELRRREREKLDASNRSLYDQIKAQEDARAAQERYTQAVESARSALATAQQAVSAAQGNVDAIRQQGTSNYISALQQVESIQDQIAQQARQVAQTYRDLGKTLREYVLDIVTPPSDAFAQTLVKALAGDAKAMADLPNAATGATDSARNASGTAAQFRAQQAAILRGVLDAAAKADELGAAAAAEQNDLQQRLITAQTDLAEALRVANAIGAPLAQTQASLIAQYQAAVQALAAAQAQAATAAAALSAIERNTSATATSAAATLEATKDVAKEIKAMGTTISVGGLVRFDPQDPIRGVFDNISRTNNILNQQFIKWLEIQSGSTVQFNDATGKIDVGAIYGFETTTDRSSGSANFPGLYILTYDSTNYLEQIRNAMIGVQANTAATHQDLMNLAFGSWSMLVRGFGDGQSVPVSFRRDYGSAAFFATGGAFSNSVVSRPTAFNTGVMGEAGPEAIMPLSNVNGSLGVRAQMPGSEALLEEMRGMRIEIINLRAEARAGAMASQDHLQLTRRMTRGGQSMPVTGVQNDPIEVKVAA